MNLAIKIFLISLVTSCKLIACSGGFYLEDLYANLFDFESYTPEIKFNKVNQDSSTYSDLFSDWQKYLDGKLNDEQIKELIFESDPEHIDSLSLAFNLQDQETIEYIKFAKLAEKNLFNTYWRYKIDTSVTYQYLDSISRLRLNTDNKFLSQRYLFQLIRANYYTLKSNPDSLFNRLKDFDKNSQLYEWAWAYYAGQIKKYSQDTVRSIYEFSKLFHYGHKFKTIASQGVNIKSDSMFADVLKLCQSDHEKANLVYMRAKKPNANLMQELLELEKYEKNGIYTKVLTLDLMKEFEEEIFFFETEIERQGGSNRLADTNSASQLLQFIERNDLTDWEYSIAKMYAYYYLNDYQKLESYISELDTIKNSQIVKFSDCFSDLLLIQNGNNLEEIESQIFKNYAQHSGEYKDKFIYFKLAKRYEAENLVAKEYILNTSHNKEKINPQYIDELIALHEKDKPFFRTKLSSDNLNYNKFLSEYGLGNLDSTIHYFNKVSQRYLEDKSAPNPFKLYPKIKFEDTSSPRLTIRQVFNKIERIKNYYDKGEATDKQILELANATFNLSFFGKSRRLIDDYPQSSGWNYYTSSWSRDRQDQYDSFFGESFYIYGSRYDYQFLDLGVPYFYAEELYEKSNNPEMKAKALFVMAQCDQMTEKYVQQEIFNELRADYADTKFVKELEVACSIFRKNK